MIIPGKLSAVAHEVAAAHGMTLEQLRQKAMNPSAVQVRREVAYALRAAGASNQESGFILGRHATTVAALMKRLPGGVRAGGDLAIGVKTKECTR